MSAVVLRPAAFKPRWRYHYTMGTLFRVWTGLDRQPQVWRDRKWVDFMPLAQVAGVETLQ